jgi:hypothetical protein
VPFEFVLSGVENRELVVGVDLDRAESGKVLDASGHSPVGQAFDKDACEDGYSIRIITQASTLFFEKAVRTSKVNHGCEIQVDAEVPTGGARRFSERTNGAAAGITGRAGGWEISPKPGKPVDDTSFEVDRDEWPWLQILKVGDQISGLLR